MPAPSTLLLDWQADRYAIDWGSLPDWLVLLVAITGTILALRQLGQTTNATLAYLRAEQGSQLMAIDVQYEGELVESRKALVKLRLECATWVASAEPDRPLSFDEAVTRRLANLVGTRKGIADADKNRRAMAEAAFDAYFAIMRLPLFIETIGVLADDGLVDEASVLKLYDAMIISTIGLVLPHVADRRQSENNPEFLAHAENLYRKAAARIEAARIEAARRAAAASLSPVATTA